MQTWKDKQKHNHNNKNGKYKVTMWGFAKNDPQVAMRICSKESKSDKREPRVGSNRINIKHITYSR